MRAITRPQSLKISRNYNVYNSALPVLLLDGPAPMPRVHPRLPVSLLSAVDAAPVGVLPEVVPVQRRLLLLLFPPRRRRRATRRHRFPLPAVLVPRTRGSRAVPRHVVLARLAGLGLADDLDGRGRARGSGWSFGWPVVAVVLGPEGHVAVDRVILEVGRAAAVVAVGLRELGGRAAWASVTALRAGRAELAHELAEGLADSVLRGAGGCN